MKRTIIAAAWVAGTTIPAVIATVLVFGCCVLPFHGVVHRVLPVCHLAMQVLQAGHDADRPHHPAPPASQKQQVGAPSVVTILTARRSTDRQYTFALSQPRFSPVAHRTFISLGAIRCDNDIGQIRLLVDTFRI